MGLWTLAVGRPDCYHGLMAPGNDSEPATKGDLKLAVDRLDKKIDKVAAELVKTQAVMRDMRHDMTGLATKDDVSRILGAIDAFAKKGETYDQKAISHGAILTDHEDKLRAHGRRLTSLETRS